MPHIIPFQKLLLHAYDNPGLIPFLERNYGYTKSDFDGIFHDGKELRMTLDCAWQLNRFQIANYLVKYGYSDINQKLASPFASDYSCVEAAAKRNNVTQMREILNAGAKLLKDSSVGKFAVAHGNLAMANLLVTQKYTSSDHKLVIRLQTMSDEFCRRTLVGEEKSAIKVEDVKSEEKQKQLNQARERIRNIESAFRAVPDWHVSCFTGTKIKLDEKQEVRVSHRVATVWMYIDLVNKGFLNPVSVVKTLENVLQNNFVHYQEKVKSSSSDKNKTAFNFFASIARKDWKRESSFSVLRAKSVFKDFKSKRFLEIEKQASSSRLLGIIKAS